MTYLPDLDVFELAASLPAGMTFPFDFGVIPNTEAADGDPLDILILLDTASFPGVLVGIRLLGVIEAEQRDNGGAFYRNDRLIAVGLDATERGRLRRLSDLDDHLLTEIETFFETYDRLRGKTFRPLARRGPVVARRLIESAAIPPQP